MNSACICKLCHNDAKEFWMVARALQVVARRTWVAARYYIGKDVSILFLKYGNL